MSLIICLSQGRWMHESCNLNFCRLSVLPTGFESYSYWYSITIDPVASRTVMVSPLLFQTGLSRPQ